MLSLIPGFIKSQAACYFRSALRCLTWGSAELLRHRWRAQQRRLQQQQQTQQQHAQAMIWQQQQQDARRYLQAPQLARWAMDTDEDGEQHAVSTLHAASIQHEAVMQHVARAQHGVQGDSGSDPLHNLDTKQGPQLPQGKQRLGKVAWQPIDASAVLSAGLGGRIFGISLDGTPHAAHPSMAQTLDRRPSALALVQSATEAEAALIGRRASGAAASASSVPSKAGTAAAGSDLSSATCRVAAIAAAAVESVTAAVRQWGGGGAVATAPVAAAAAVSTALGAVRAVRNLERRVSASSNAVQARVSMGPVTLEVSDWVEGSRPLKVRVQ